MTSSRSASLYCLPVTTPADRPSPPANPGDRGRLPPAEPNSRRLRSTATIGFVGVVVGALLTLIAGVITANISADSAEGISVTEYRRSQVDDVYGPTNALVKTIQYESMFSANSWFIEDVNNPPPRDEDRAARWRTALQDLNQHFGSISLVASKEVVDITDDLLTVWRAVGVSRDVGGWPLRELSMEIEPPRPIQLGQTLKSRNVTQISDLDRLGAELGDDLEEKIRIDLGIN